MKNRFKELFWESVATEKEQSETSSYLSLGGTSLGIFMFTEKVKSELNIEIPAEELLSNDASLEKLMTKYQVV